MKATVVEIQSKQYRLGNTPQPYRLICLQFDVDVVYGHHELLRLPENLLGVVGLSLDDVVDVEFSVKRKELFDASATA